MPRRPERTGRRLRRRIVQDGGLIDGAIDGTGLDAHDVGTVLPWVVVVCARSDGWTGGFGSSCSAGGRAIGRSRRGSRRAVAVEGAPERLRAGAAGGHAEILRHAEEGLLVRPEKIGPGDRVVGERQLRRA